MAGKVSSKDLYTLVKEQINKELVYNTLSPYGSQTKRDFIQPFAIAQPSANAQANVYTIVNSIQTLLDTALESRIISGLEVKATDSISNRVLVTAGSGTAGGRIFELASNTYVPVPFDDTTSIFHLYLYYDRIVFQKQTSTDKVHLADVIIPKPGITNLVQDKRDNTDWNAYIMMRKKYNLYGDYNGKFEEDTVELLRDNIGEILADNIIGNIRLSENLKITNTQGTLTLDSSSMTISDKDANDLAKFNKNGIFFYDSNGVELAKFATDQARIGNIVIEQNRLYSSNFASGALGSGFEITDSGNITAQNIIARGKITTSAFEKNTVSVIGGNLAVLDGDVLAEDMSSLNSSTMKISGDTTLAIGDLLNINDGVDSEWFEVTDNSSAPTYTVTRDKASSYTSDNNPEWKKGTAVSNYRQSGDGLVYMSASDANAPFINILTHAGLPWDALTTHVRLGNLNGFLGYSSDAYGIGIGNTNSYLKYDPVNNLRIKGDITITGGNATVTFVQDITPGDSGDTSTPKEGDIWYKTPTNVAYVYSSGAWELASPNASGITDANGKLITAATPTGSGLFLGSEYLGFYSGGVWNSYLKNDGTFQFQGDANNYVNFDGANLNVKGVINVTGGSWSHASDGTKIDGGEVYTGSISASAISVTNLAAINADLGTITAGTITGGTIQSAASGSRVLFDADKLVGYDGSANEVFKVLVSTADAGDVIFGDYTGNKGIKWDASAATLNIIGTTIQTAASGARLAIFPDANTGLVIYDDSSNKVFEALIAGTNVGDVIFGNTASAYMKWDKSAGTLLADALQSTNYVLNTSGWKLDASTGLEVNDGSISGKAAKNLNFEFGPLDFLGRAKGDNNGIRAATVDTGNYRFFDCENSPTWEWEKSRDGYMVYDGGSNKYLGLWFIKREDMGTITWAGTIGYGSSSKTVRIRLSIAGATTYGSYDDIVVASGSPDTFSLTVDISGLTNNESYFVALTGYDTSSPSNLIALYFIDSKVSITV